jgi:hypothetical protein
MGSTLDGPTFTDMKYNPSLAYRGTQWFIATFTSAPERGEYILLLSLIGAIVQMFHTQGLL